MKTFITPLDRLWPALDVGIWADVLNRFGVEANTLLNKSQESDRRDYELMLRARLVRLSQRDMSMWLPLTWLTTDGGMLSPVGGAMCMPGFS